MTAFAKFESASLTWEMRSLNSRYLEVDIRLPSGIREIESTLRGQVRDVLARGKVDATLRLEKAALAAPPRVNRSHLRAVLGVLAEVRDVAPEVGQPDALELLRWPGVVGEEAETADDALKTEAVTGFERVLQRLVENRGVEGAKLDGVLREKLAALESMVADVRCRAESFAPMVRDRMRERLRELNATHVESGRLEQEVALLAQKADVAEELDRLGMHAQACRDCLGADGPQGRRLDFLMQELAREANTLTAKAITSECAQRAVELKVVVDQLREQVQNVE